MVSLPTHEEISARAFQIYVASGYIAGHDLENWLQAEAELSHELQNDSHGESSNLERTSRNQESQPSKTAAPVQSGAKSSATTKPAAKRGIRPKGISSKVL